MKSFLLISLLSVYLVCFLPTSLLWAREPIEPLPVEIDYDIKKAEIGKALFTDKILSKDRSISCASCHDIDLGGADKRVVSIGVGGLKGNVQSPTVFNSRYNFKQFWNGRVDSLLEQASGPVHNPTEMGMDKDEVEKRINASEKFQKLFSRNFLDNGKFYQFNDPITYDMVIEAIAEFEKALVTPNSKFDRYLRGEEQLSQLEASGYQLFKNLGCVTCHNGINIGGNSFQKMGTIIPYTYKESYPDRYSFTLKPYHKNVFKVPTLRNIALSAPYFHDASAKTLEQAIKTMSHHNLGYNISDQQIKKFIAFLNTLTGEKPAILE